MNTKNQMPKAKHQRQEKGITLIALVITVIVLLILAGTAISIAVNGNNIFAKANTAVESYNARAAEQEAALTALNTQFDEYYTGYNPDQEPAPTGITMTLKTNSEATGTQVTITQANFAEHLGKIAVNYSGAPTTVTVGSESYNVSNTYRLYWIDWTNKYGDGTGTIYLKADATSPEKYPLQTEWTTDTIDAVSAYNSATPKIRNLNPEMYKTGKTLPAVNSYNMMAVRWLTNPNNWNSLKTGVNTSIANRVNYIVGAPSLEMMMDSYNAHYGLTNASMDTGERDASLTTRTKIGYVYPINANNYGYGVGPSNNWSATDGYDKYMSSNAIVQTDSSIDSMYYPGTNNYYWLASPSAYDPSYMLYVWGGNGGVVLSTDGNYCSFCPLVSLQSDVQL